MNFKGSYSSNPLVIKFCSLLDVPAKEDHSSYEVYIHAYIATYHPFDSPIIQRTIFKLQRISQLIQIPSKFGQNNIKLETYRNFNIIPPSESYLVVRVYQSGLAFDPLDEEKNLIAFSEINLKFIQDSPNPYLLTPNKILVSKYSKFSISLCKCFSDKPIPENKTFFLIRHGESTWNVAQSKIDISGMIDNRDHPLSKNGISQALLLQKKWKMYSGNSNSNFQKKRIDSIEAFEKEGIPEGFVEDEEFETDDLNTTSHGFSVKLKEFDLENFHNKSLYSSNFSLKERRENYIELFLKSDKIYCSPFTRAIQTALVSLKGHPALQNDGIHLMSVLREFKRIGGFDSVGVEVGNGIIKRVTKEFSNIMGPQLAQEFTSPISLDIGDTNQVWWTSLSGYDSDNECLDRLIEFITFLRYSDSETPIFVGHSLFFKSFYTRRISGVFNHNREKLCHNLRKYRLGNASLLAVTVSFLDSEYGMSDALIVDADLIFGGGFHGQDEFDQDQEESIESRRSSGKRSQRFSDSMKRILNRIFS